jgi:hypothetical protein
LVLIVLTMLILPQMMNTASFAEKGSVAQAVQLKNATKAEEMNHLFHVALTNPPTNVSPLDNFNRIFPNVNSSNDYFTQGACPTDNPCLKRLASSQVNICPADRFMKKQWDGDGKTYVSLACRNGQSPSNAQSAISCGSANLSNTADIRVFTCVYDKDTRGANMAISVWSYMNLTNKFIKVQEDSF